MLSKVNLYFWLLEQNASVVRDLRSCLSAEELRREARFAGDELRDKYTVGRGVMRHILAGYAGREPSQLTFEYSAFGKPALRDGLSFNLSHTRKLACLAVARSETPAAMRIGVDIEGIAPVEPGLAQRIFAADEVAAYENLSDAEQLAAFYRCWTQKEAVMKASGLGMSLATVSFSVDFMRCVVSTPPAGLPPVSCWSLAAFEPDTDTVGALAVVGEVQAPRIELEQQWWSPEH